MTGARAAAFALLLAALLAAPAASLRAQPGDLASAIVPENTELASRIAVD